MNDYLAQRDADGRQPIYRRCGLVATAILNEMPEYERASAYRQSIVYTTQKELVADWLRDQLRLNRVADPVSTRWLIDGALGSNGKEAGLSPILVPGLHVAIVDEADAASEAVSVLPSPVAISTICP